MAAIIALTYMMVNCNILNTRQISNLVVNLDSDERGEYEWGGTKHAVDDSQKKHLVAEKQNTLKTKPRHWRPNVAEIPEVYMEYIDANLIA